MKHSKPSSPKPPVSQTLQDGWHYEFEAIGTAWAIDVLEPVGKRLTATLIRTIDKLITDFDRNYSRFRDDSLVSTMARASGAYTLPKDAKPLLDFYENLYDVTGGAVTPLIGQTLSDAGYDATYSLQSGKLTVPPAWREVLDYNFPKLTIKQPALLDFGAAGKGYLVDLVAQCLQQYDIKNFCVDAGGDMVYRTTTNHALDVGLEHPADLTQAIGIAHIKNQSLCGSAGNRRSWGSYTHIINPHNLKSPKHIAGLWVTAASGLVADGLTTALFFTPAETLQKQYTFEYAIVYQDLSLEHSAHFPADFFTNTNQNSEDRP